MKKNKIKKFNEMSEEKLDISDVIISLKTEMINEKNEYEKIAKQYRKLNENRIAASYETFIIRLERWINLCED